MTGAASLPAKRSRRANGEASIYQDTAGQWHGWVTLGRKPNGKPDRRHRRGDSRQEVVDKVNALQDKRARGEQAPAGKRWTVGRWVAEWLEIKADNVSEGTMSGYRPLVELHIVPELGAHYLESLEPEDVEAFYRRLKRKGMAPATIRKVHSILKDALAVAKRRGRASRNVCTEVDPPKVVQTEAPSLTAEQARAVVLKAMETRLAARWAFALEVGCRQAEALGIRWSDLDLDPSTGVGVATIRRQLRRSAARHGCDDRAECPARQPIRCPQAIGGGLVVIPHPKSKKPRAVALSAPLVELLTRHRKVQQRERETAGSHWTDDPRFGDLVFRQANGRPLDPRADFKAWGDLLESVGLPRAGTHLARHTAASLLLSAGTATRVAQERLGHSDMRLTSRYQHVSRDIDTDAAQRIEGVLWS